jgi:3-methyladenine DNA glycosylase AlkD
MKSELSNQRLLEEIFNQILELSQKDKVKIYTKFFRANQGDICENDLILAVKIPELRKLIKKYYLDLSFMDIKYFLDSKYNEVRFFGQQVLKEQYNKTKSFDTKSEIINFLLQNHKSINHWNLVDGIAPTIGNFWIESNQLDQFIYYSQHESIWLRRISIVACLSLIRTKNKDYLNIVLEVLENNKSHKHEYIHKAMGWILRELSKTNEDLIISFLRQNWSNLSSVTRSYSTERIRRTRDIKLLFGGK